MCVPRRALTHAHMRTDRHAHARDRRADEREDRQVDSCGSREGKELSRELPFSLRSRR